MGAFDAARAVAAANVALAVDSRTVSLSASRWEQPFSHSCEIDRSVFCAQWTCPPSARLR